MWTGENNDTNFPKRFSTPPPSTSKKWRKLNCSTNYHVLHKIPSGDSPYVKAKHVQLIEKDPNGAIALFWNAINSGDRVDSALKDMAVVMKQLDRPNEAIEAIKSFRHLCTPDSQESLDNVLVELYKRSGRLEEQIEVLQLKLKRLEEGHASAAKEKVKLARSHGKKVYLTAEQEYARLLGNLAWAHLQQNDYKTAEDYYRKALSIESDRNKQCNLAICLISMNRIIEAKFLLKVIRDSALKGQMDESCAKSFKRASKLMAEMEGQPDKSSGVEADEKVNHYQHARFFAFSPCKKPYESSESNRRRVSDYQLDYLNGQDFFSKSNVVNNSANFSWKGTCTPPVQSRRIPKSPFTQPQRSSILFDSGNWKNKKEPIPESPFTQPKRSSSSLLDSGYVKAPISCFPRKLQFENPSSKCLAAGVLKTNCQETERNMSVDSSPVREVDGKENIPTTDFSHNKLSRSVTGLSTGIKGGDSCVEHHEWNFSNCDNKGRKSWADMIEEDEQEIMHLFSGALMNPLQRLASSAISPA